MSNSGIDTPSTARTPLNTNIESMEIKEGNNPSEGVFCSKNVKKYFIIGGIVLGAAGAGLVTGLGLFFGLRALHNSRLQQSTITVQNPRKTISLMDKCLQNPETKSDEGMQIMNQLNASKVIILQNEQFDFIASIQDINTTEGRNTISDAYEKTYDLCNVYILNTRYFTRAATYERYFKKDIDKLGATWREFAEKIKNFSHDFHLQHKEIDAPDQLNSFIKKVNTITSKATDYYVSLYNRRGADVAKTQLASHYKYITKHCTDDLTEFFKQTTEEYSIGKFTQAINNIDDCFKNMMQELLVTYDKFIDHIVDSTLDDINDFLYSNELVSADKLDKLIDSKFNEILNLAIINVVDLEKSVDSTKSLVYVFNAKHENELLKATIEQSKEQYYKCMKVIKGIDSASIIKSVDKSADNILTNQLNFKPTEKSESHRKNIKKTIIQKAQADIKKLFREYINNINLKDLSLENKKTYKKSIIDKANNIITNMKNEYQQTINDLDLQTQDDKLQEDIQILRRETPKLKQMQYDYFHAMAKDFILTKVEHSIE